MLPRLRQEHSRSGCGRSIPEARHGPQEQFVCLTCDTDDFSTLKDAENCCNDFLVWCEYTTDDGNNYCEIEVELSDLRDPSYCPAHVGLAQLDKDTT